MSIYPDVTNFDGASLSKIEDNLKYKYTKYVEFQGKNHKPLTNRIKNGPVRTQDGSTGKQIVMGLKYGLPQGHGFAPEAGSLPKADYSKIKNGFLNAKYAYGTVQITGQAEAIASGGSASFVDQLATDLEDLKDSILARENKHFFGNGTGALATVTDSTNKATKKLVVADSSHLAEGFRADIYTGNTLSATNVKIASVDYDTNEVTFGASDDLDDVANGDIVYFAGSKGLAIDGLDSFCDVGTYAGINGALAGNSWWRANVLTNPAGAGTPRTLTRMLLRSAHREAYNKTSNWPTVLVSNNAVQDAYADSEMNDGQWRLPVKTIELGYEAVVYRNTPWICDEDCAGGKLYFLNEKNIKFYVVKDWGFIQHESGSIFRTSLGNSNYIDAKEATMRKYYNLGCDNRRAQTVLCDLAEN